MIWEHYSPSIASASAWGLYTTITIIKNKVNGVLVDELDEALKSFTEVLGFVKKTKTLSRKFKWLTVASPEAPDAIQLVLEPNGNPAAKTCHKAILTREFPQRIRC